MAEFTKTYTFNCPYCGHDKIVKNGRQLGKQRYRCKSCAKQFNDTGAVGGRHATAEQIGAAVRMYYGGTSFKQTAETLNDAYDIPEPSKETLYRWVTEYTDVAKDILDDFPAHTSGKWVADEIQVRVGGEKHWLWNVMDAGTRYALAVHLSAQPRSTRRRSRDAKGDGRSGRSAQVNHHRQTGQLHRGNQGSIPGRGPHPVRGYPCAGE